MKKILFITLFIVSYFSFGQKVKLKDGSVLIDKVEVYKYNDDGVLTISTLSNKEIFIIKNNYYEVPNPLYGTAGCPASTCNKTYKKSFITFRFLENGNEFSSELSDKDIIKNFYKSGILKEDGTSDEEKREIFINKYSNDNLKYKLLN